jgi:hypothetical protein
MIIDGWVVGLSSFGAVDEAVVLVSTVYSV